ncbi:MAG: hypothetical protein J7L32_01480 [Thermoplasmata archaeon]|nr:hypothetical protein [Thermoplasmata archaeon]
MTLLGFSIPLWFFALLVIFALVVGWKIIKFALTILAVFILALIAVALLDFFNVFTLIKQLFPGL